MVKTNLKIGYIELMLAQLCLAINFIVSKSIVTTYPIMSLLFLRFLIGFVVIALYLWFSASKVMDEMKILSKRDWILLILQALCSGFLFNVLFLYGLQYTSATSAGIINSTCPVFIVLFSALLLKEYLTKIKLVAILCAAIGIGFLSIGDLAFDVSHSELYGLFIILIAMIPGSLFSVLAKMMKTEPKPLTSTAFTNFVNLILFLPLAFIDDWNLFYNAPLHDWWEIAIYCLTGGVLFFFFWYKGLNRTTANTAALFFGVKAVATSILAYFFLSESLTWFDATGMLFVILSTFIGVIHVQNPEVQQLARKL